MKRFVGCERTFGCPPSDAYLHTEVHDRREVSYTPGLKLFIVHLSTDGKSLISSYVAYKWKHRNQGGWMVGTLLRQYDPAGDNDDLSLPADSGDTFVGQWNDGTVVVVTLSLEKYCSIVETSDNHLIDS